MNHNNNKGDNMITISKFLSFLTFASLVFGSIVAAKAADLGTNSPYLIKSPADLKVRIPKQLRITKPDFVVFVTAVTDEEVSDTGNEHFLVFDGADGAVFVGDTSTHRVQVIRKVK